MLDPCVASAFPITLGELEIDAHDDCNLSNDNREFYTWSYEFTLGVAGVDVPQQTSGMLMTATGDYRALNIAAQSWSSVFDSGTDYHCWAVHPQR